MSAAGAAPPQPARTWQRLEVGPPGPLPALTLGAAPQAVGWARRWVARHLELVEAPHDVVVAGELLTSELVTNAVRHGSPTGVITLRLQHERRAVVISVHDEGPGVPIPTQPGPADESGRGLPLVDALATTWGTHPHLAGGKSVWFRLAF